MHKKFLFIAFILIAVIQLAVPVKSIYEQEDVLANGKEFKFQTAPVDPNDPFRGKYVVLRFKENSIGVAPYEKWTKGEEVFVHIDENEKGFATISYATKTAPEEHKHYCKATIRSVKTTFDENNNISRIEIRLQYPFNRFYMEESKAKAAEDLYRKSTSDTLSQTYALVNLKNGLATLKDVMIDGVSIKDAVEKPN
ncbi:GDYXXLXY domain-containing protein [Marinifilum caeruleilacunae]|uniref:GDYXXLXY protein n=1 Tax=Marinifilum caeruleilacunae TaxID=2499076 RepID=A0ABX1WVE6_9BACT|nr:GDYXXLXY domain-containing protein [Marinifilum caeruleilacunae]NOU60069.1 hypothetical protein [Marinifilum caeruleilacunae]